MNSVPTLNFLEFVAADGDCLTTTSQGVAVVFGKRHDHVLRQIRNLLQELPERHRPNFGDASYEVAQTNGGTASYACYRITRDGFTLLAMGFTGKKALGFKLAYIDAFNSMAAFIKMQRESLSYRRAVHELAAKDSDPLAGLRSRPQGSAANAHAESTSVANGSQSQQWLNVEAKWPCQVI
jgi:Rha family phage regulatory protein